MNMRSVFSRAKRSLRQDLSLHLTTIGGLVIAFACLGVTLLVVTNIGNIASAWKQSRHITVYLREDAKRDQVTAARFALEGLPEIKAVQYLSPEDARSKFGEPTALGKEAVWLPADFFPASLEVSINRGVTETRLEQIAIKTQSLAGVREVEIYRDWFEQLSALLSASRWAAGILSLLVALCVLAVISHSVRLAVSERRAQIEVLKLCGATDGFVTGPFVVEGLAQGVIASFLAIVLVFIGYSICLPTLAPLIGMVTGVPPMFLDTLTALALVVGGGSVGGLSSLISLRRHLSI